MWQKSKKFCLFLAFLFAVIKTVIKLTFISFSNIIIKWDLITVIAKFYKI